MTLEELSSPSPRSAPAYPGNAKLTRQAAKSRASSSLACEPPPRTPRVVAAKSKPVEESRATNLNPPLLSGTFISTRHAASLCSTSGTMIASRPPADASMAKNDAFERSNGVARRIPGAHKGAIDTRNKDPGVSRAIQAPSSPRSNAAMPREETDEPTSTPPISSPRGII